MPTFTVKFIFCSHWERMEEEVAVDDKSFQLAQVHKTVLIMNDNRKRFALQANAEMER